MSNELIEVQKQQIASWESPAVLQARIEKMKDLMKRVMKKDTHYGIISGCKKPSLWQPGQQILSVAFKIGYEPESERIETGDGHITYRTKTRVFDQITGVTLGYGIGECSSAEEKYAWKRCYIEEEFNDTPIEQRRVKYSEYQGKVQKTNQIRTNPADVANTILKMSAKRSKISGCLDVVAAGEIFTQDIEDLPPGMDIEGNDKPVNPKDNIQEPTGTDQPQAPEGEGKSPDNDTRWANKWISDKQEARLYALCKQFNVNPEAVKAWLKVFKKNANVHLYNISCYKKSKTDISEYDKICETIEKQPKFYDKYVPVAPATPAPAPAPEPTAREVFEIQVNDLLESAGLGNEKLDAELKKAGFSTIKDVPEAAFSKFLHDLGEAI